MPGDLFYVALPGGRFGGGQVLAASDDVVHVAVAGVVWDCAPGADELAEAPRAVDHVALRPDALATAQVIGRAEGPPTASLAAWEARPDGARIVVAAPFAALVAALLADAG